MNFSSIDFETANPNVASICQVGIARFEGSTLVDQYKSFIDPEDYFDEMNMMVHGIGEGTVRGAPNFRRAIGYFIHHLHGQIVVCHTHFDRVAFHQACLRYGIDQPVLTWLDTARVARRAWADCSYSGYGLSKLCKRIDYKFDHHDALEDAKAAGHILLAAVEQTGFGIEYWLDRVKQPINPLASSVEREGNPDGPLSGEVVVFTGTLEIKRTEAADIAASLGCKVIEGVTKKTTMIVVGDQDVRKLNGQGKSAKHRKAEKLIFEGHLIKIIRESDFNGLAKIFEKGSGLNV